MAPAVRVSDGEGVRTITLARPDRLNAINLAMIEQLRSAVETAMNEDTVRAILLNGAGRAFCAGDDVDEQADICAAGEAALRSQLASLQAISAHLVFGPKPSVAAVRGWAIGAGFSWVLNCDFSVWGDGAIGFLPEAGLGSHVTGGASALLPLIAGHRAARAMLLRGHRLSAGEAFAAGIASAVVADDDTENAAASLARELAQLPALAAQSMKQALIAAHATALREALAREVEACVATTLDPATIGRMRNARAKS